MKKINLKTSIIILTMFMFSSCAVNRTVGYEEIPELKQ